MVQIGSNAPRLSRAPKIRFTKGIQRTNEDSQLGFVSDLNNMEINEGTLQRRKGSKLLNNNTTNRRWYFLEEVEISGCNLLVGLDYKRDFYAFHPQWPETEFKVLRKGLEKRFHPDTTRDFHVSFRRGSKFFLYANERYAFVTNDFGDTLRFDKKGYISFAQDISEAHERRIPGDFTILRASTPSGAGVWVDVLDASNRDLREFYLFADEKETVTPIIGSVRLAWKNECGVVSKFSPPINLARYQRVCASLYAGQSIVDGVIEDSGFEKMVYTTITTGDYTYWYLAREGSLASPTYIVENSKSVNKDSTFADFPFHVYYIAKNYQNTALGTASHFTANQYVLAFVDGAANNLNATAYITSFVKIKNIRGWNGAHADSKKISWGDIDSYIEEILTSSVDLAKLSDPLSSVTNVATGVRSYTVIASSTATKLYRLKSLNLDNIDDLNNQIVYLGTTGLSTWASFNGTILECDIEMNTSSFANYFMAFKTNLAWQSTKSFFPKGFDCWDYNTSTTSVLPYGDITNIVDIDIKTKTLTILTSHTSFDTEIIISDYNLSVAKFWEAGSRFVVWNNGRIIGENQKLWGDGNNNYKPIYEESQRTSITTVWSGELSYNSPNYDGTATATTDWRIIYQPFSRLEYQAIRGYPYKIKELSEIIINPINMVLNKNVLFVIQEGNLWIGDTTLMLNRVIELSYTVYDMIEFYDGVLISGSKGLFYFGRTLDERFVKKTKIKTMIPGEAGAFYIDFNDHVWKVDLVFGQTDVPFVRTTKISDNIKEVTWGANPQMLYTEETLWIKTEQEIWGYRDDAWTRKISFDNRSIKSIHSYDDKLVVVFERNVDKRDIYDDPDDVLTWFFDDPGSGLM